MAEEVVELAKSGAFYESLRRKTELDMARVKRFEGHVKDISHAEISELQHEIQSLKDDRDNMLDEHITKLLAGNVFLDTLACSYVKNGLEIDLKIRDIEIKIDMVKKSHDKLFGEM